MTRPIAAMCIVVGGFLLAIVMGITLNLRFGFPIFQMFMLLAAPFCLAFGVWLRGHGFQDYARYAMAASVTLVIGVAIPLAVPGTIAYFKSVHASIQHRFWRAAQENTLAQQVECGNRLVGDSETLYWFHPDDDPIVCYDKAGKHPKGRGTLLPVDDRIAQIIERQRSRPVAQVVTPAQPEATPEPPSRSAWLEVPPAKPD